ncbi:transglycosylase family protein [Kocuria soli]|uniref:transglycosylase family protein n=1 Tax=Kocuria soli TaxID=2485125 RepID=UPI002678CDC5
MKNPRFLSAAMTVAVGGGTLAAVGATPAQAAPESDWDALAQCESSGDWSINTGNGFFGGLQFTQSTWQAFGGTGMPQDATREQQIAVAENVLAEQGWGAWPACSSALGLNSAAEPVANPMGATALQTAVETQSNDSTDAPWSGSAADQGQAETATQTTPADPAPRATGPKEISDIEGHYAQADIEWAEDEGVVHAFTDGTFRPDANLKRRDFALMLYRMAGEPATDTSVATTRYSDVPADSVYIKAISWATEAGLFKGWDDGTFRPDAAVDASAVGIVLHRSAGSPAHEAPATSPYTDAPASMPGYTELDYLVQSGVLSSNGGALGLSGGITRGDMTSALHAASNGGVVANFSTENTETTTVEAPTEAEAATEAAVEPAAVPAAETTTETAAEPAAEPAIQTSEQAQQQAAAAGGTGTSVDVQTVVDGGGTASGDAIVSTALQGLGGSYVWGGTDFMSWDCSGFTQWVYAQHGIQIPRVTWDQFAAATPTSNPQPGDLVSQNNGSHVGIYLGDGQMISALNPQQGTIIHSVDAMQVDGFYTYL